MKLHLVILAIGIPYIWCAQDYAAPVLVSVRQIQGCCVISVFFSSSSSDGCFHTVIETYVCREGSGGQICSHNARRRGRRGVQDKGVTLGPIFQHTKLCITTATSQRYRFQELSLRPCLKLAACPLSSPAKSATSR